MISDREYRMLPVTVNVIEPAQMIKQDLLKMLHLTQHNGTNG